MTPVEQYLEQKRRLEHHQAHRNKVIASNQVVLEQLEKEFGCKSIREAKKKLKQLARDLNRAERELNEKTEHLRDLLDAGAD